ncbi:MAG: CopD family protein [Firmicutes bacterium]|nr:CopD family protein [Bacillota bacterium]
MSVLGWASFLHVLAVVLWIGGVFFLDLILVPRLAGYVRAADERARLLFSLFRVFFAWVWVAGLVLVVTGYGMVWVLGGLRALNGARWTMVVVGTLMVLLALYIYFGPYWRMGRALTRSDWEEAGRAAARVRLFSGMNLVLAVPAILAGVWSVFGL